jgi:hypothetical protein
MIVPSRKSGENEYVVSYDKPNGISTATVYGKDETQVKKVFETYLNVNKQYTIRRIRKVT